MDVHVWASNQHGLWSSLWALAFVFLCVSARHVPRRFMLQNRKKPAKTKFLQNICASVKMTNNEVLVIGLHMVGRFKYGIVFQSNLEN